MKKSAQPPTAWFSYLLGVRDVTGICQNKSAKLVKILHCPPPPVRRTETLKHNHVAEALAAINLHCQIWR